MKRAAAVLIALALVAGLGYWLGTRWDRSPAPDRRAGCQVGAEHRVRLDADQMANAATITAVGVRLGMPDRAVQVALATALQESKLRNLPHLGARNDHDSVGLFQQRPSQGWGSEEELTDPRFAAERFYRALAGVDGWQQLRLTEAAQRVQRSAFPEAYEKWEPDSGVLATALLGDAPGAVSCTVPDDPPTRGADAATALGDALTRDWGTPATTTPPAVSVAAPDPRTGWRYAHWLVAHASERGVRRVHFADLEWTAPAGQWSAAGTTASHVLAEVAAS